MYMCINSSKKRLNIIAASKQQAAWHGRKTREKMTALNRDHCHFDIDDIGGAKNASSHTYTVYSKYV